MDMTPRQPRHIHTRTANRGTAAPPFNRSTRIMAGNYWYEDPTETLLETDCGAIENAFATRSDTVMFDVSVIDDGEEMTLCVDHFEASGDDPESLVDEALEYFRGIVTHLEKAKVALKENHKNFGRNPAAIAWGKGS
jgi:hypothetical protein